MDKIETIADFYKRKFDWMPDNLKNEIGHFNVFNLEPFVGDKAQPVPYKRRDFYKIMLVKGNSQVHYADKVIETKNKYNMARIFITGSSDGLGQMAANLLITQGHHVVLHARNEERGKKALAKVPGAEKVLTADLSSIDETKKLAEEVNAMGSFDAIIHNAGVYQVSNRVIFAVNSLAPYILTCLIKRPKRLIYLSSGMHLHGDPTLENLSLDPVGSSYSDSKLHVLILSIAVARKWQEVYANAVNPGWVPTKMGGPNAPDSLQKGAETQAWLAVSNTNEAKVSGRYFYHMKEKHYLPEASNTIIQEKFLTVCQQISGVHFPADKE